MSTRKPAGPRAPNSTPRQRVTSTSAAASSSTTTPAPAPAPAKTYTCPLKNCNHKVTKASIEEHIKFCPHKKDGVDDAKMKALGG